MIKFSSYYWFSFTQTVYIYIFIKLTHFCVSGLEISASDFMDKLDSSVQLCMLANLIQSKVEEGVKSGKSQQVTLRSFI